VSPGPGTRHGRGGPGRRAAAEPRLPGTAAEAARVSRALAVWTQAHRAGAPQTEEFARGLALAMRPAIEQALAEARKAGISTAQVQADLEARLAAGYRENGWEVN
jgi:hypothetical protein